MTRKIGIVMDPIQHINYKKDSSLAMLWAAKDMGWELWYMEQSDLYLEGDTARASMRPLDVHRNPEHFYDLGQPELHDLHSLDAILMRKDPPFDLNFIYTTYLLERAEQKGTLIVNKPQSLRDCNEKLFATWFPECCPELIVAASADRLKAFHEKHQDTIFKPLDGMGGTGIFRVKGRDSNISVILEVLTEQGKTPIMGQQYLPEIKQGDKRILIVNGEVMPYCLARIPSSGELRGNLAAGGSGVAQPLSEQDYKVANHVAATLVEKGLLFVGLDIIGDRLTEINVTSPTCIREIQNEFGIDIAGKLMTAIEQHLSK